MTIEKSSDLAGDYEIRLAGKKMQTAYRVFYKSY